MVPKFTGTKCSVWRERWCSTKRSCARREQPAMHRSPDGDGPLACSRTKGAPTRGSLVLGHRFHGEGQQRGFPLEDQVVFENYFSAPPHRNGTFLELGAHDGVAVSNTVWFERALGWSGVLIEASSKAFRSLVQHRGGGGNSLHNAVICPRGQTVIYREPHSLASVTMAGIDASMPAANKRYRDNRHASLRELPCRPLSELLAATHEWEKSRNARA